MKQGKASRSGDYGHKVEPDSRRVDVASVSRLGNMVGTHVTRHGEVRNVTDPVVDGRGFNAPKNVSHRTNNSGSQGRH